MISVSITLLALLLFTSVIHKRVTKYKYQQEVKTNHILADQIYQRVAGVNDLNIIRNLFTEKNKLAQMYAILDKNNNEIFVIEKNKLELPILNIIFAEIKKQYFEGKIKNDDGDFFWLIKDSPEYKNKLLLVYPISPYTLSEFINFFGLPFFISGFLLCWVMVWASIILSSLIVKLQNQKNILSDQAADIEKARDEAMHANSAKSNFIANMSHEIRTPLTSIIGFAETCLESNQTMQERLKATKTIIKSGKYLTHIINEILDLSKIEAGKLEIEILPLSIMAAIEEINQLVSIMAEEKGLTFTINYLFPIPDKILSDQLRIKQILLNLCSNAIKFTIEGHVYLNISYDAGSSNIMFEVIDTGIGISEAQKEKIFKPFEQADSSTTRKFGGTGLGLTLSKQLVEMLNGELSVDSIENKGSRFTAKLEVTEVEKGSYIYENIYKEKLYRPNSLNANVPLLAGKVLVAEDNKDIQDLVRLLLNKAGIEPDIVENGELAVELAKLSTYDLVFLDIQMPVMDGFRAIEELRQRSYVAPVVAMTANAMKEDREKCKKSGFSDFISKPIDQNDLYSILTKYLKSGQTIESDNILLTSNLLSDDPDLIDLIDRFITRLPIMRDAINQAYSEGKEEELSGLIHQMKGVGGNYGYPALTELCAKIEFQIINNDEGNVAALIEEFNLMVDQILDGKEENHKIADQSQS